MSKLIWTILLSVLLCDLILSASGEPEPEPEPRRKGYRRPKHYHRPHIHVHPHPHPHCPPPKPVPCKPSPCKPVPCRPVPCTPCGTPTVQPTSVPCSAPRPSGAWANNYDESFIFECPKAKQSIMIVNSLFSTCHHDRIWSFECGYNRAALPLTCHWLNTNSYGRPVHFRCPHNGFIAGMQSHHQPGNQDRKFRFKCCNNSAYRHKNCIISHEVNDFTEPIKYDSNRNKGNYLAGIHSYYNQKTMDRRWKFETCQLQHVSPQKRTLEETEKEKEA